MITCSYCSPVTGRRMGKPRHEAIAPDETRWAGLLKLWRSIQRQTAGPGLLYTHIFPHVSEKNFGPLNIFPLAQPFKPHSNAISYYLFPIITNQS